MIRTIVFTFLLSFFCTSTSWAACEREDVDHYLEKGFTPEQIVTLCESSQSKPLTNEDPSVSVSPAEDLKEKPVAVINEDSLPDYSEIFEIHNSVIQGNIWTFSTREKIKYGEKDVFGRFPEIEITIRHRVDVPSLRIVKRKARIPFFRGARILFSAKLSYQIDSEKKLKPSAEKAIKEFKAGELENEAFFLTVRKNSTLDKADLAIAKLLN